MKKSLVLTALLVTVLIVVCAGCVAGPNAAEKTANKDGHVAGIWSGIWHGFISPVTFIVSLFTRNVRIYEIHNNGNWYNFGFVLGAGLFLSGGILGRKRRRH